MSIGEVRVRRPADHEVLIKRMQEEGGFLYMRDVLLFAAGVGVNNNRRFSFQKSSEPIRYDTLTEPSFSGTFVSMLSAYTLPEDPEILAPERLDERVKIFEEYANGGLEYIQEAINMRKEPLNIVLRSLLNEALTDAGVAKPATIDELLKGIC